MILQELIHLISCENHAVLIMWALELVEEGVQEFALTYPNEMRPQIALDAAKAWALGKIKMREAQRAILNCHAIAKELDNPQHIALCHAIAQGCSVVHTPKHAIGFPIYELTALVYQYGIENAQAPIEKRIQLYLDRLQHWHNDPQIRQQKWAKFIQKNLF